MTSWTEGFVALDDIGVLEEEEGEEEEEEG